MTALGLLGRSVWVEIGPENGVGFRLADLRVSFKVEFKAAKSGGTATIRIYNPAPTSIALLRAPLSTIRLLAGYGGVPRVLFAGTPVKGGIVYRVEAPDRVLEVDAHDGGRSYVDSFLRISIVTPTTFGAVLALILAETQWVRGAIDLSIESVSLPHGIVLTGRPAEVMDRLAAAVQPLGADWYVRDGALYVVRRGAATAEVAPLLSSTQGNLIGWPTATKTGVRLRALVDASMRPGRSFIVQSLGVNGTYVATDVTFTGDSGYEQNYYMDIDAKPIGVP